MPGKVKVRILAARHLPIMDRSSENTDAYAEVKFGEVTHKTEVMRKSLNPQWNSEWFRFEAADDMELQDEPLQIRVMDYDTYSANDAIGKVYIDLNPLLLPSAALNAAESQGLPEEGAAIEHTPGGSMMSGWLPIYDTMHGIRGEVHVVVKIEFFSDFNQFRQSSCGVQFFYSPCVPEGYRAQAINGFVEELMVNDDPEYQWIDKIRTPRASNEARQTLFMKLSGAVQRKIGLKAIELGGNVVVGYQQKFDIEGDTGIAVRGIGTAMTIVRDDQPSTMSTSTSQKAMPDPPREVPLEISPKPTPLVRGAIDPEGMEPLEAMSKSSPDPKSLSKNIAIPGSGTVDRITPELEQLSFSPKGPLADSWGEKLTAKLAIGPTKSGVMLENQNDLLEYPFITIQKFPTGFLKKIGGFVSCRSVKILDGLEDDCDARESWWNEIRQEIRSHARCLGCNMIVGYSEDTVIWDDVVVLCASGTAASGNLHYMLDLDPNNGIFGPAFLTNGDIGNSGARELPPVDTNCLYAHIPYMEHTLPFTAKCGKCQLCGKGRVPDVLFTTIEPPSHFEILGRGCLIQAKVLRLKKDLKGENNAKEISDGLPFIEYEIHRQLINKLKVKGMNALFGLKLKVSMGDRTIIGTATATACYLAALPSPSKPKLICSSSFPNDPNYLQRCQKRLDTKIAENEKYYGLNVLKRAPSSQSNGSDVTDMESDEGPETEFASGNKDTCVLEIDDSEDADILDSLMDPYPPPFVQVFSTEELVGIPKGLFVEGSQTFSQVWRGRIHPSSRDLSSACQRLLAAIYFKLRRFRPCIVSHVSFQADLDEENELQLCIYGTAIGLAHEGKTRAEIEGLRSTDGPAASTGSSILNGSNGDAVEGMEECRPRKLDSGSPSHSLDSGKSDQKLSKGSHLTGACSAQKFLTSETQEALFHGSILLTPSSFVPGARIDKYLGNLNFFIIRESSSLREVGGLNHFIQSFLSEVFAIVRSHVHALGGNALVAFFMLEFVVEHSAHKNQGQCIVHVGGDVVAVTYLK
eukprot:maker-scaffold321_size207582-snap-gene-1.29 protein:Tk05187 transcript:maker-scaffold321_size207582-snap-gene-1.29-mRNA-1 annotation:"c2 domain-containing protein 5 isoform x2"